MKKNCLFFFIIYILISACGDLKNTNYKFSDKDYLNNSVEPYFSYYTINSYGDYSNLMRFNFSNNTAELLDTRFFSGDAMVVQKMNIYKDLEDIYFIERFSTQKPSRVTYLTSGNKFTENSNFPMNLHALAFFKESIVGVGYDLGEAIQTSKDTQKIIIGKRKIENLHHTNYATASISSSNLSAILHDNQNIFVVSQGSWNDNTVKPYIYQLDDKMLTVKNSWPIPNCFNAARHVNVIDSSKLVVLCNPYQNNISNTVNVFLIDISNFTNINTPEITKILTKERIKNGFQYFEIGGLSADRNSIFINEKAGIYDEKSQYVTKYTNTDSYWFNLKEMTAQSLNEEARKIYVSNVSGSVIYNNAAQKYLFSCLLDTRTLTCQIGRGAVSTSMDAKDYSVVNLLTSSRNYINFPTVIF